MIMLKNYHMSKLSYEKMIMLIGYNAIYIVVMLDNDYAV